LQWTITGTDGGCGIPTSSDLLTVTYYNPSCVQANAGPNIELCMPMNNVAMNANAAPFPAFGQWSIITGSATFTDVNSPTTMALDLPVGMSVLRWTINSGACCPESFDDVVITVYSVDQPPAFTAGPDQDICNTVAQIQLQGSTVPAPYMGQWTLLSGGGSIADPMDNSTTVTNLPIGQNIFRWTATVGAPCTNSVTDDVVINVFDCSVCSVNAGADVSICMGSTVQLQAVASGIGPFTYNWSPAMGLSNAAISNPFASPLSTVSYTVTISNAFGCTASDNIVVAVNTLPTVNAGNDITVCSNASPTQLTGFTPTGGTWIGSGVNATGLFTPGAVGTYTLTYIFTSAQGCTATDLVDANVLVTPVVSAGLDATICIGGTTQLIGAPAGGVWSGAPFITTNGLFSASVVGSYTLTYTYINQQGCAASDQMIFSVLPLPVVNAGNDIVICPGDVATLCATAASANGPIVTYIWSPGMFLNACIEVDPANTTSYTVAVVDAAGCQAANQVVVMINSNSGCTDPEAANYNAAATCDDGSCSYLGGDFNGDGVVSIEEFNIVLGNFGCTSPACSASDLDNDGMVGMSDLLILIGNMGG
jgi:large repetitive protein